MGQAREGKHYAVHGSLSRSVARELYFHRDTRRIGTPPLQKRRERADPEKPLRTDRNESRAALPAVVAQLNSPAIFEQQGTDSATPPTIGTSPAVEVNYGELIEPQED